MWHQGFIKTVPLKTFPDAEPGGDNHLFVGEQMKWLIAISESLNNDG